MVSSRSILLAGSFLSALTLGSNFLFGAINLPLGNALEVSDVSILGSCLDLGSYLSILIGTVYVLFGIKITSVVCAIFLSGGYLLLYFIVPLKLELWVYGIVFFVIGQGSAGFFIMALTVNSINYFNNNGIAVGMILGAFGACALVFANLFLYAFNQDLSTLFLVMLVVTLCTFFLFFFFIKVIDNPSSFNVMSDGSDELPLSDIKPVDVSSTSYGTEVTPANTQRDASDKNLDKNIVYSIIYTFLTSVDAWIIWFGLLVSAGLGLSFKNIIGNFVLILQDSNKINVDSSTIYTGYLITGWSISFFSGKVVSGYLSDRFESTIARPYWLTFASFLFCISSLLFLVSPNNMLVVLWISCILNAIAMGTYICISFSIIGLLLDKVGMGINYAILFSALAVGGLIFTAWAVHFINSYSEDMTYFWVSTLLASILCGVVSVVLKNRLTT